MKKAASILAVIIALVTLLALVLPFVGCQIELPEDRWVNFHNDLTNTGYSTSGAVKEDAKVKWDYSIPTGAIIASSPTIRYDQVYVAANDGTVYCLEKDKGGFVWKYKTGGTVLTTPAVAGHKVFVGADDGYVYALDEKDGVLKWKT